MKSKQRLKLEMTVLKRTIKSTETILIMKRLSLSWSGKSQVRSLSGKEARFIKDNLEIDKRIG